MRTAGWTGTLLLTLVALAPLSRASADRSRGEVILVVEVLEIDATPATPCGRLGRQPRDVLARVVAIESDASSARGALREPGETIRLRWRTCRSLPADGVVPGRRFRVVVSRRGHDAHDRYLVRRAERR